MPQTEPRVSHQENETFQVAEPGACDAQPDVRAKQRVHGQQNEQDSSFGLERGGVGHVVPEEKRSADAENTKPDCPALLKKDATLAF